MAGNWIVQMNVSFEEWKRQSEDEDDAYLYYYAIRAIRKFHRNQNFLISTRELHRIFCHFVLKLVFVVERVIALQFVEVPYTVTAPRTLAYVQPLFWRYRGCSHGSGWNGEVYADPYWKISFLARNQFSLDLKLAFLAR